MNKNAIIKSLGLGLVNSDSTGVVVNEEISKRVNAPLDDLVYGRSRFGWPSSDIDVMNMTNNMEVKNALERRNQKRSAPNGTKNDDVALDTVVRNGESAESYADRMAKFMDEYESEVNSSE